MCEHYGIDRNVYRCRLNSGWTQREALGIDKHEYKVGRKGKRIKDHLGNEYSNIKEMCLAHGADYSRVSGRLRAGWSVKDALENSKGATHDNS